jgi:hypothetical protein
MGLAAAAGAFGVSDAARAQAPSPNGDVFVPDQGGEPVAPGGQGAPDLTPGASPDPGVSLPGSTEAPAPGSTVPSASDGSTVPGEGGASPGGTAAP